MTTQELTTVDPAADETVRKLPVVADYTEWPDRSLIMELRARLCASMRPGPGLGKALEITGRALARLDAEQGAGR